MSVEPASRQVVNEDEWDGDQSATVDAAWHITIHFYERSKEPKYGARRA